MFEYDSEDKKLSLESYSIPKGDSFLTKGKRNIYLTEAVNHSKVTDKVRGQLSNYLLGSFRRKMSDLENFETKDRPASVFTKYKPVALKVRPVYAELPEQYRIKREIKGDPLEGMPILNPNPPDFIQNERYTQERKDDLDKVHKEGFLWLEERKLMHHLVKEQWEVFAWDDTERG